MIMNNTHSFLLTGVLISESSGTLLFFIVSCILDHQPLLFALFKNMVTTSDYFLIFSSSQEKKFYGGCINQIQAIIKHNIFRFF